MGVLASICDERPRAMRDLMLAAVFRKEHRASSFGRKIMAISLAHGASIRNALCFGGLRAAPEVKQ